MGPIHIALSKPRCGSVLARSTGRSSATLSRSRATNSRCTRRQFPGSACHRTAASLVAASSLRQGHRARMARSPNPRRTPQAQPAGRNHGSRSKLPLASRADPKYRAATAPRDPGTSAPHSTNGSVASLLLHLYRSAARQGHAIPTATGHLGFRCASDGWTAFGARAGITPILFGFLDDALRVAS